MGAKERERERRRRHRRKAGLIVIPLEIHELDTELALQSAGFLRTDRPASREDLANAPLTRDQSMGPGCHAWLDTQALVRMVDTSAVKEALR